MWELRAQLGTDPAAMPVEDAAKQWSEDDSPYLAVARITAAVQQTWSNDQQDEIEDGLSSNPWTGLAAHRPLGSVMRGRKPAYAYARGHRARASGVDIDEPLASASA